MNDALEKLGMSMAEYFIRLHYAFWEVAKSMLKEIPQQEMSKEQLVIKKLKQMGVIENDRNAGK